MGTGLEETIATEYERMLNYTKAKLSNRQDAEDAVQETMRKAWQADSSHIGNPKSWLWRILHNVINDQYRSLRRRTRRELPYEEQENGVVLAFETHEGDEAKEFYLYEESNVVELSYASMAHTIMARLIDNNLTEFQRNVIVLFYFYEMNRAEIAAHLYPDSDAQQADTRTASLLTRGRQSLRRALALQPKIAAKFELNSFR